MAKPSKLPSVSSVPSVVSTLSPSLVGASEPKSATALATSPFATAREHAQAANLHADQATWHALQCGLELLRLKAELGITQGKRTDKMNLPHAAGSWAEVVQREVGISDDTARRWMHMAEGALGKIEHTPESFLPLPPTKRADALGELERLAEAAGSQRDFLRLLFGVQSDPPKPKGGYRETRADGSERAKKRTKAQIARDLFEHEARLHLPKLRERLDHVLALILAEKAGPVRAWDLLDDAQLEALKAAAADLRDGILATQKRRAQLRGKQPPALPQ